MNIVAPHPWNVQPKEASRIQRDLSQRLSTRFDPHRVKVVAGVDVGMKGDLARAVIAALSYPDLVLLESQTAEQPVEFPYIPGLLAFREGPAILRAMAKLSIEPDLFIFDGQGIAHPRRMGIATHIGIIIDHPSIGCAKSRLCGVHRDPGLEKGSIEDLHDKGELVGAVVRTRTGVKPVFVSVGHKIDLATAIDFVLKCCGRYRLPEPIRWAHKLAANPEAARDQEFQQTPQQRSFLDELWNQGTQENQRGRG